MLGIRAAVLIAVTIFGLTRFELVESQIVRRAIRSVRYAKNFTMESDKELIQRIYEEIGSPEDFDRISISISRQGRHDSHHHHHHNKRHEEIHELINRFAKLSTLLDGMQERCYSLLNGTEAHTVGDYGPYHLIQVADLTYWEAEAACAALGMTLASIDSADEQAAVHEYLSSQGAFVGDNADYIWLAGNNYSGSWVNACNVYNPNMDYTNWLNGVETTTTPRCAAMGISGFWEARPCDGTATNDDGALCEVPRPCSTLLN